MTRTAIVTGGARGIGRGIALSLARRGFALALADRLGTELEATVAEVTAQGGEALALGGDVGDHGGVQSAAASVLEKWGQVDVLVATGNGRPAADETGAIVVEVVGIEVGCMLGAFLVRVLVGPGAPEHPRLRQGWSSAPERVC